VGVRVGTFRNSESSKSPLHAWPLSHSVTNPPVDACGSPPRVCTPIDRRLAPRSENGRRESLHKPWSHSIVVLRKEKRRPTWSRTAWTATKQRVSGCRRACRVSRASETCGERGERARRRRCRSSSQSSEQAPRVCRTWKLMRGASAGAYTRPLFSST